MHITGCLGKIFENFEVWKNIAEPERGLDTSNN
jgi:hypothetical protein